LVGRRDSVEKDFSRCVVRFLRLRVGSRNQILLVIVVEIEDEDEDDYDSLAKI